MLEVMMKVYEKEGKIWYEYRCPSCHKDITETAKLSDRGDCDLEKVACPECAKSFRVQIHVPSLANVPSDFKRLVEYLILVPLD